MWSGAALQQQFDRLGALLQTHEAWWRPRAFVSPRLPWEQAQPALAAQLRALTMDDAECIAADNDALQNFFAATDSALAAVATALADCCAIGPIPPRALPTPPEARDVPGRKWLQIQAFTQALPDTALPATEWCAGKAHLGRHYARCGGAAVDALEWRRELIEDGNRLAQRERLPVHCHHIDVLASAAREYLHGERRVLALHACGQLHIHLLSECTHAQPRAIALAPCCYHLQPDERYAPLSQRARERDLTLSRLDLKTAVQESVTSPERVQKQRRQLQAWRLGFDELQRDLRGVDAYLPTPSFPLSVLQAGFETFCVALAQRNHLELPIASPAVDFADYAARGDRRLREVAAMDLPRQLFRRALELWLVLDRALLLQESGYEVAVGTFCERALTPRNLLILAERR